MVINILSSHDIISYYHFYPLFVWNRKLKELDCCIKFFNRINDNLFNCDALIIDNRFFSPLWSSEKDKALNILTNIREKCSNVIWMDVTDSTGTTQFQVLPFVDKYLKKQILKDRNLYLKSFYNARIFTDYYKNKFSLKEEEVFNVEPIKQEFIPKLHLSWNMAFGPFHISLKLNYYLRRIPYGIRKIFSKNYNLEFYISPNRTSDICFRGADSYNNLALAYQRMEIIKKLNQRGIVTQPVKLTQYISEIRNSKICVSPFGSGEICFRDFETFINGGMLLKPDMSHLETWPNFYEPHETYVPFKWDLSDFDKVIDDCLRNEKLIKEITVNGQEKYKKCFSEEGSAEFCQRFIKMVK